jgi:hypothetical protein
MGRDFWFGMGRSVAAALASVLVCSVSGAERGGVVCSRVAKLVPVAEQLRGLSARRPIRCRELGAVDYGRRARRLLSKLNPSKLLEYDERISKMLGIIPEEFPYASCMADGQDNASWALYDRDAQEIVVRAESETPDPILVHEIVHALQDQHFNLAKLHGLTSSSDRGMAIAALIEGDAIDVEVRIPFASSKTEATSDSGFAEGCEPPDGLFNSLMFVYEWGGRFLTALPERDSAFYRPPCSTRQVLYPKEYLLAGGEACPRLNLGQPPGPGWLLLHHDVLGEFIVRNWMKGFVSPGKAILAAKGLKGDRVELFRHRRSGEQLVRWIAEFDSELDGDQMMDVLRAFAGGRSRVSLSPTAPAWRVETSAGGVISVRREGERVSLWVQDRRSLPVPVSK